jgi:hypothetical protein
VPSCDDFRDQAVLGGEVAAEHPLEFLLAHRIAVAAQDFQAPLRRVGKRCRRLEIAFGEVTQQPHCDGLRAVLRQRRRGDEQRRRQQGSQAAARCAAGPAS